MSSGGSQIAAKLRGRRFLTAEAVHGAWDIDYME